MNGRAINILENKTKWQYIMHMEAIKGIYENGIIHPLHKLNIHGKKKVIITFLEDSDLSGKFEDPDNDLTPIVLSQFSALEEDWSAPGMEDYDNL